MMSVNGSPEAGPTRIGIALVDMGTGLYAAIAVLMALQERSRSGLGQYIDMTLYDSAVSLMHPHIPNHLLSGKVPGLTGSAHPNISPYDKYPTKTCEIFLAVGNDPTFLRLCRELGRPDLAENPRFASNADRLGHRDELTAILVELLADRKGEAFCARLLEIGVPAGPVLNVAQVLEHPHTEHREMLVEKDGYQGWGNPIKFSRSHFSVRHTPPRFGAQGRTILAEFGFGEAEVENLIAAGVVLEERRK